MTGTGPKSQRSKTKVQSEKLQGKEREERRSKGGVQQTSQEVIDTGTANHGAAILPKEQREVTMQSRMVLRGRERKPVARASQLSGGI